ncbi:MAG: hypothetical protein IPH72_27010 [Sandaracinaceae bacterium]|nr:hypothetical protein [Sandaracinaceae bacterium]
MDARILERLCGPERQLVFRVPWQVDRNLGAGAPRLSRGLQRRSRAYRGGLRFTVRSRSGPSSSWASRRTFKNALWGPAASGGGKGDSDFDPKGKSDNEVFTLLPELRGRAGRHLGEHTDVPADDIGVGAREIGFLFGHYKRFPRPLSQGCSPAGSGSGRALRAARGHRLWRGVLPRGEMLRVRGETVDGRKCVVSGSGGVAIYAIEELRRARAWLPAPDSGGIITTSAASTW